MLLLFSSFTTAFYAEREDFEIYNNSNISLNLLVEQSVQSLKKYQCALACLSSVIYYNKEIIDFMAHRPYISSLSFYFLLHYACDCIISYQEQQTLLDLIMIVKKMTTYLAVSHGIKNYMQQRSTCFLADFSDEIIFNNITKDLPYSFDEITLITFKAYQELKLALQALNTALFVESEEFVFLCHASSINVQNILYLTQSDPALYQAVHNFEKNPDTYFADVLNYLKLEITKTFVLLENKLPNLRIIS